MKIDLYDHVCGLDELLIQLRPVDEDQANALEELIDTIMPEPQDVRDLRHALRPYGYDSYTPMLPEQQDYTFLLGTEEYIAITDNLLVIKQNDGLRLDVSCSMKEVDRRGLPYLQVVVSRA